MRLIILVIFEFILTIIKLLIKKSHIKQDNSITEAIKSFLGCLFICLFFYTNYINESLLFTNIIFILAVIFETLTLLFTIFDYLYGKKIIENHLIGFTIFKAILKPIFNFFYRPQVINSKYIPKTGPIILAGNHRHLFDQCLSIPATRRMVHYMAKKEYFDSLKTRWFFKLAGCISVDRKKKDSEATLKAIEVLNQGQVLGIFPEGTRNKTDEDLLPFKFGTVSLAQKTGSKIVPYAIRGEYIKYGNNLVIEFGKPFAVGKDLEKANKDLENIIRNLYTKGKK